MHLDAIEVDEDFELHQGDAAIAEHPRRTKGLEARRTAQGGTWPSLVSPAGNDFRYEEFVKLGIVSKEYSFRGKKRKTSETSSKNQGLCGSSRKADTSMGCLAQD